MRMIVWICVITCSAFSAFAAAQPVYAGLSPNRAAFRQTTPQPPSAPIHTANEAILARLNRPFTVGLRQWVTVTDTPEHFGLQLSALVSDSRCPAQVNCIVAGQAEFRLLLRRDDVVSPRTFQIGSYPTRDQNKVQFGEYVIELQAVEPPAPPPSQQLNPSDYRVTLLVRRSATPSPTPTTAATPTPTATTEPQDAPGADPMPRLGQPFIVRVGATASLTDIDFQLTLRSLSEDSGCLTATDCSVMTADGTLVLQQGDTRQLLTFITSMSAGQSFDYDFAGYVVRLLGVEVGRDGNQIATFVVERPMADVVIPEPERVMSCPSFSIFDAAAILQEEVEPRAIVNLVFGPIAPDAKTITGFCGYLAAAYDRAPTTSGTSPRIASDVSAVRGVIATIVKGNDSAQLLQLAHLLIAGGDGTPSALYQLQAELMAGDDGSVISTLTDLAVENVAANVLPVNEVGEEGLWFWQPLNDGYFGMLIARDGERFAVVMALLNREADEEFVRDHVLVTTRHLE